MDTNDVEAAVRLVLPALNLEPAQFQLDPSFFTRAQRSRTPLAVVLNQATCQLVFAGQSSQADPDTAAAVIASEALASLTAPSRSVCERLIVAWAGPEDQVFAAAYVVSPSGAVGQLLGASWSPPETWLEPMIDIQEIERTGIDGVLDRLESTINGRGGIPRPAFDSALERALRLVDLALLRVGGEGQHTSTRPSPESRDVVWRDWVDSYRRSVRDEWDRARGVTRTRQVGSRPTASGPLAGLDVFLSYARPDAASMAWPVRDALCSCGASVWFDQEQQPDEEALNSGLADTIARCDAYVMCATDEFIERGGYATQELAWAIQQGRSGKITRFLAIVKPTTVLPRAVAAWPAIEFRAFDREGLAGDLVSHLQNEQPLSPTPGPPQAPPFAARPPIAPLPTEADLAFLRIRARHVIRFDEIDYRALEKIATSDDAERDAQVMDVRRRLLRVGEGLDWSGTLQDIDHWPTDSLVRDLRLRLAGARALAGTRWPLTGKLDSISGIAADVDYLAMRPVPLLDWPAERGWDDSARSFALRHHAGLLRLLQEPLRRGLTGGILEVPFSTVDVWVEQISRRRLECIDAILDLRLQGRLSWQSGPPAWDSLFRAWHKFLTNDDRAWANPVPSRVTQLLTANAIDLAASGADTVWYASLHEGLASQSLTSINAFGPPVTVELSAQSAPASGSGETPEKGLRLLLTAVADSGVEIRLSWNALRFSSGSIAPGESSSPAPAQLERAFNFLRS